LKQRLGRSAANVYVIGAQQLLGYPAEEARPFGCGAHDGCAVGGGAGGVVWVHAEIVGAKNLLSMLVYPYSIPLPSA
jgi:hypothetical protein